MKGLASRFLGSALIYAVLGMTLGVVMGMTQNHTQMPTHAHLLVVGWVSFALFGFFYHLFPSVAETRIAAPFLARIALRQSPSRSLQGHIDLK